MLVAQARLVGAVAHRACHRVVQELAGVVAGHAGDADQPALAQLLEHRGQGVVAEIEAVTDQRLIDRGARGGDHAQHSRVGRRQRPEAPAQQRADVGRGRRGIGG